MHAIDRLCSYSIRYCGRARALLPAVAAGGAPRTTMPTKPDPNGVGDM
jgi:hypothetical protein